MPISPFVSVFTVPVLARFIVQGMTWQQFVLLLGVCKPLRKLLIANTGLKLPNNNERVVEAKAFVNCNASIPASVRPIVRVTAFDLIRREMFFKLLDMNTKPHTVHLVTDEMTRLDTARNAKAIKRVTEVTLQRRGQLMNTEFTNLHALNNFQSLERLTFTNAFMAVGDAPFVLLDLLPSLTYVEFNTVEFLALPRSGFSIGCAKTLCFDRCTLTAKAPTFHSDGMLETLAFKMQPTQDSVRDAMVVTLRLVDSFQSTSLANLRRFELHAPESIKNRTFVRENDVAYATRALRTKVGDMSKLTLSLHNLIITARAAKNDARTRHSLTNSLCL